MTLESKYLGEDGCFGGKTSWSPTLLRSIPSPTPPPPQLSPPKSQSVYEPRVGSPKQWWSGMPFTSFQCEGSCSPFRTKKDLGWPWLSEVCAVKTLKLCLQRDVSVSFSHCLLPEGEDFFVQLGIAH